MKSKRHIDRKTKIEQTLRQANKISEDVWESHRAWVRLCNELGNMVEPESRMPRFNGLLNAVWVAATNEQS